MNEIVENFNINLIEDGKSAKAILIMRDFSWTIIKKY